MGGAWWLGLGMMGVLFTRRPGWAAFFAGQLCVFAGLFLLIASRWVNYTAVIPILLVGPLWGVWILPWKRLHPRAGYLAVGALVLAQLIALSVAPAEERRRLVQVPYATEWITGGKSYQSVVWKALEPEHRDRPLVLFLGTVEDMFLICRGEPGRDGIMRCYNTPAEGEHGVPVVEAEIGGRRIATQSEDWTNASGPGDCIDWQGILDAPPWSEEEFLVLEPWASREVNRARSCRPWEGTPRCEIIDEAPGITLWRCP